MAVVRPFRALQFTPAAGEIAALTCPPYDIISEEQRRAFLARNPHNVIRLELPREGEDPYAAAGQTLAAWKREGLMTRPEAPAFYLYAIDFTAHGREYALSSFEWYQRNYKLPVSKWAKQILLENRHASTICKTCESLGIQRFRLNLKICFFHVFYPPFLSFFQACFYRLFRIE